ncbi:zinc finger protein 532 [Trichonephila clavipes]|nr:zinc finger protein 532 [Trichonephila clavipes]
MTSVATNILKLPPKQIQVSPDKLSISTSVSSPLVSNSTCTVSSDSNDPSVNWTPVNVLKQNDVTDLSFKARNLQLLTTNAVSPFFPKISRLTKTPIELHCCSGCRDTFAFKSSLRFHLDRRSILIQFPCEACKSVQIFFNRCSLLSHIRSHENKNEPSDIEKAVVNPLPLELMIDVQTEDVNTLNTLQDELNCMYEANEMPPSELEFSINDDDTIIIKEKPIPTNALKVKCVDCNEEFENAEARKEHLTNGGKIPVLISPCNKCGMVCPSKCSLKAHQRLHLQISPYICPECGENPDEYWEKFQNHVKYKCFHHARSIGCRCPVCKRVSPSRESVLKHMELHTEKYLKCDSCNKAYMTMLSFEDHVKEHVGKCVKVCSIYRCSLCDVVFLNTDQLLIHRTAHLKEELSVYVFNCMQCGETVENKGQLLDHIKILIQKFINLFLKMSELKQILQLNLLLVI